MQYEGNPYDLNDPNDYDDNEGEYQEYEVESVSESVVSSTHRKKRRLFDDAKKADKGYGCVKRDIKGKKVLVEYYSTGFRPGTVIRNAVTGIYDTSSRVGRTDEYLYFKVCNSTGEGRREGSDDSDPQHLYYDSPQQYERHFGCELSVDVKSKWAERLQYIQAERLQEEPGSNVQVR